MTRRDLLLLSGARLLLRQACAASEPQNLSYALGGIEGTITPPDLFFVREHFPEPGISLDSWRLKIEGRVAHPLELSLADLIESPTHNLEAVLECAGNAAGGAAAGNGQWEGVPLAHVLREAGAAPDAAGVLLEGADSGRLLPDSQPLPYTRLVPIAKCLRPESMIALKRNDRFLPRRAGFPARAFFPGWYAMDSVKWLRRIVVLGPQDEPAELQRSGMNRLYTRIRETAPGDRVVTRLTEIQVKSAIAWPTDRMHLPAARHLVRGFAWTGTGLIRGVDISTDGGQVWTPARLESRPQPFRWVRWQYAWDAAPGDHVLLSRAGDDAGHRQPLQRDRARKDGYEWNDCAPVRCSVR